MTTDIVYPRDKNVAILADGVIVPMGPKSLSPSEIIQSIREIVNQPYKGTDPAKKGKTLLDAAHVAIAQAAADGDLDALEKLWNRLMGKPVQQIVQATGTLKEFLDGIARSESDPTQDIDPFSE